MGTLCRGSQRSLRKEGQREAGTGVTDAHKLPCECWDPNLGPLQEEPVLSLSTPCPSRTPPLPVVPDPLPL